MSTNNHQPKVIVCSSRFYFYAICHDHRWNPTEIKYVQTCNEEYQLQGYYAEDVYPTWHGKHLPHRPKDKK